MAEAPPAGVALIGPLDLPVGGVSSHLRRLVDHLRSSGVECTVIDPYAAAGKRPRPEHEVTPLRPSPAAMIWAAWRARRSSHPTVHLHFSRVAGWFVVVAFLLSSSRKRLAASLHHGDQQAAYDRAGSMARLLSRMALRRMDVVVALSDEQEAFYRGVGVAGGRIVRWRTAPGQAVAADPSQAPAGLLDQLAGARTRGECIMVSSGYPKPSYRYELCIDLLQAALERAPAQLLLCIYGGGSDEAYMASLRRRAEGLPVTFVGAMPPAGFLAVLQHADLYLRPSLVDSYGLAVSDALDAGAAALASDICERDPRAVLFPANDPAAFEAEGLRLLQAPRPGPRAARPADQRIVATYAPAS